MFTLEQGTGIQVKAQSHVRSELAQHVRFAKVQGMKTRGAHWLILKVSDFVEFVHYLIIVHLLSHDLSI